MFAEGWSIFPNIGLQTKELALNILNGNTTRPFTVAMGVVLNKTSPLLLLVIENPKGSVVY